MRCIYCKFVLILSFTGVFHQCSCIEGNSKMPYCTINHPIFTHNWTSVTVTDGENSYSRHQTLQSTVMYLWAHKTQDVQVGDTTVGRWKMGPRISSRQTISTWANWQSTEMGPVIGWAVLRDIIIKEYDKKEKRGGRQKWSEKKKLAGTGTYV